MKREIKKLKEFRKWFDRYIRRNFGKKCPDFVWSCPVCRAYFLNEVFDDFIEDLIETENWSKKRGVKSEITKGKK